MSIYDLLKEAGYFSAKAGCVIYKEYGVTAETVEMVHRIDELALELLDIAEGFK